MCNGMSSGMTNETKCNGMMNGFGAEFDINCNVKKFSYLQAIWSAVTTYNSDILDELNWKIS